MDLLLMLKTKPLSLVRLLSFAAELIIIASSALCGNTATFAATAAGSVRMEAGGITYTISPGTLQVSAETTGGATLVVSGGIEQNSDASELEASANAARWKLPRAGLIVQARAAGDSLEMTIQTADDATSVTWPIQSLKPQQVRALIWPRGEGSYIPIKNAFWTKYLASQSWNTLEDLDMPVWGLETNAGLLSCVAETQFRNQLTFSRQDSTTALRLCFTHEFRPGEPHSVAFRFRVASSPRSLIEPAIDYRRWLIERGEFRSLAQKMQKSPAIERLFGAPQLYLWGGGILTRFDFPSGRANRFAKQIVEESKSSSPAPGKFLRQFFSDDEWKAVNELAGSSYRLLYAQNILCDRISEILRRPDFYNAQTWSGVSLSSATRALVQLPAGSLSPHDLIRRNCLLLHDAYAETMLPVDQWGGSYSTHFLTELKNAGLDRLRIAIDDWQKIIASGHSDFCRRAMELGYLIGPYDSYHSIHDPATSGTDSTWPTAQFDQHLFETGPIVSADGTRKKGFKQKGFLLSPVAARPYVEKRVTRNFEGAPFNFYFFDCDGFGQLFDDYSPLHRATQVIDGQARNARMNWVAEHFGAAVATEGGSAYATQAAAQFEGVFARNFGWGDPDMTNRKSAYYVGGYYPPEAPAIFFKAVPAKDQYVTLEYDPRFRIPLWEAAFHDSAVSGHHWSSASLKFSNVETTVALTEFLYQVPPMYHLNPEEFARQKAKIVNRYKPFSPLHRLTAMLPMTGFEYLTDDRTVQRSSFGEHVEIIANFRDGSFSLGNLKVPAQSVIWTVNGESQVFSPRFSKK
jgi:hypothetical protein